MVKPPRFHTKPIRDGRRSTGTIWRIVKALLTLGVVLAASAALMHFSKTSGEWTPSTIRFSPCADRSSDACVVDGDTIILGKRKIRITGYNAPELAGECEAEKLLARQSRDVLINWLNDGPILMSGGDTPAYDQYGRELREIRRGSVFLADVMIDAGLAQGSGWGFTRGGWCE